MLFYHGVKACDHDDDLEKPEEEEELSGEEEATGECHENDRSWSDEMINPVFGIDCEEDEDDDSEERDEAEDGERSEEHVEGEEEDELDVKEEEELEEEHDSEQQQDGAQQSSKLPSNTQDCDASTSSLKSSASNGKKRPMDEDSLSAGVDDLSSNEKPKARRAQARRIRTV